VEWSTTRRITRRDFHRSIRGWLREPPQSGVGHRRSNCAHSQCSSSRTNSNVVRKRYGMFSSSNRRNRRTSRTLYYSTPSRSVSMQSHFRLPPSGCIGFTCEALEKPCRYVEPLGYGLGFSPFAAVRLQPSSPFSLVPFGWISTGVWSQGFHGDSCL